MCRSEEGLPRDQGRQGLLEIFQLRGRLAGLKSESGRGAQMLCHKNNKWTGAGRGALLLRAMLPRPVLQVAVDSGQGHKILPVALQAQLSHHSRPLPIGYFCYGMCQPLGFSWGNKGSGYPLCPLSSSSCEMVYLGVARVLWLELLWTVPSQCTFLHTCLHVYH